MEAIRKLELATEKHEAWWVKEAQNRIMAMRNIKLAIAFVGLNIMDAALTAAAMNKDGVAELNPIMSRLLGQPEWMFWTFKIGMALIFALVLLILSDRFPRQVKRIFIILIAAMLGICLFNLISLL